MTGPLAATRLAWFAFTAIAVSPPVHAEAPAASVIVFPKRGATGVNPDTHLLLTFSSTPTLGRSGQIKVYDADDHHLVDSLDLSIPAGPDPTHRVATVPAQAIDPNPTTPTTTTPAVRTTPADLRAYQLTTIGGLSDFHFYPVIIHGNVATVNLHNNVLRYKRRYSVQIDPGVLILPSERFEGITKRDTWSFTTKAAAPSMDTTRVVVAADGSADFSTVQGAVDFVSEKPPRRVTIFIRNGTYEEIIFIRHNSNLTLRGEDREKVHVGYGNNSAFNPPTPGPSRRCAFSVYESTGIELANFSIKNSFYGQAEGLLVFGCYGGLGRWG